jgi:hypothetical protein
MSLTNVFTSTGVEGLYEKSLEYLFPEFAGKKCPIDVSGTRLLERSSFIQDEDVDIILRRRSLVDPSKFDLSLLYHRGTWFLDFDQDAGLGDPRNYVEP